MAMHFVRTGLLALVASLLIACGGSGGGGGSTGGGSGSVISASRGGTLNTALGLLSVPPNSLQQDTRVEMVEVTTAVPGAPEAVNPAGKIVSITPSETALRTPASLRLAYDPSRLVVTTQPSELAIYRLEGSAWLKVTGSTPDSSGNTVTAPIERFGTYTVMAKVPEPLPAGQRSKWTVLVFMNAANDLFTFSDLNMNQMEKVAGNPDVRFVVQWKQSRTLFPTSSFDGTRRYLVYPDLEANKLRSKLLHDMGQGVDMGQASTLREFVEWGKAQYPADRYVVILWNHGNGWHRSSNTPALSRAVSYDDQTGNAIQIWELPNGLNGLGMDVVSFDSSLMQMVEVAYELRHLTPYVVGSEESPPGEGYPYDLVFARFRDQADATTRELTKAFVDGMLAHPPYASRKITQSVVETSRLESVKEAWSSLADALIARPELADAIRAARQATQGYSLTSWRRYFDMIDFCDELTSRITNPEVLTAVANAKAAVRSAIVWEGHNTNSPGSHGLSIDLSNAEQFAPNRNDYSRMLWALESRWDEWLAVAP